MFTLVTNVPHTDEVHVDIKHITRLVTILNENRKVSKGGDKVSNRDWKVVGFMIPTLLLVTCHNIPVVPTFDKHRSLPNIPLVALFLLVNGHQLKGRSWKLGLGA